MFFCTAAHSAWAQQTIVKTPDRTVIRMVPDSVSERLKKEKEFLYANDPAYWQEEEAEDNSAFMEWVTYIGTRRWLKWVLYALLGAFIAFAIYQVMVVNDFFIFSKRNKKKLITESGEAEHSAVNIDESIMQAIHNREYRLAIRFMYLKTLQQLHEKQLIRLHAKATNRDYLVQMQAHRSGADFKRLTRIYEYVWYGKFQPSDHQFDLIRSNFNAFISAT